VTATTMRDRAVVLGGGLAGLLAARVLADEYAEVCVLEPDPAPGPPDTQVIRDALRALPNVTIVDGFAIVGVRPSADRRRVIGVRATSVRGEGSRLLPADLVVDASGAESRVPADVFGAEPPAGFLVAGAATARSDQAPTVAALGAVVLREQLRGGGEPDPHRYVAAVGRMLDVLRQSLSGPDPTP
jgi:2-polyprenyl-6-methoxyphenol hydroxylase-like FAD-dependent oxidoreductase